MPDIQRIPLTMTRLAAVLMATMLGAMNSSAQTLVIPTVEDPPNSSAGVPRPVRGMTMAAVLAKFGEPLERSPAVGDPPISRWRYQRFTVYFEHDLTLHATVHRN